MDSQVLHPPYFSWWVDWAVRETPEAERLSCLYPEWLVKDSQEKGPRLRGAVYCSIWPSNLPSPICCGAKHQKRPVPTECHPRRHKYASWSAETFPFLIECVRNLEVFFIFSSCWSHFKHDISLVSYEIVTCPQSLTSIGTAGAPNQKEVTEF